MELEFKKGSKILGIIEGYYFKGELLSRYKTEAIKILRERIETAGSKVGDKSKTNFEKGMEICKDEWQIVHDEFEKCSLKVQKTHEKKKPYYAKIHRRVLERKIETLRDKIGDLQEKKLLVHTELDQKITNIQNEINEIKKQLENGN